MQHFASQIDQTCGVLKLLGLVEEASSNLGFKPTPRLIEIITDRMVQPTVQSKMAVGNIDNNLVDSLWQLVAWVDEEEEDKEDEQEDEDEDEDKKSRIAKAAGTGRLFAARFSSSSDCLEKRLIITYPLALCKA